MRGQRGVRFEGLAVFSGSVVKHDSFLTDADVVAPRLEMKDSRVIYKAQANSTIIISEL